MNFVESNGKKVAAILCVASALPVVGTIYAMGTQPGWHGDKYVKKDRTIAKNDWVTTNKKSVYLDKDGNVDTKKSYNASATALSDDTVATVTDSVKASTIAAVGNESKDDAAKTEEAATPAPTTVVADQTNTANTVNVLEEAKADSTVADVTVNNVQSTESNTATVTPTVQETVQQPTVQQPSEQQPTVQEPTVQQPAEQQPTVQQPSEQQPTVQQPSEQQPSVQQPSEQTPAQPAPSQPAQPAPSQPSQGTTTPSQNSSFNQRVADAAKAQIGQHEWCTETATDSLNAAAGSNVYGVYWPDQYKNLGTVFTDRSQLQPGNLVYYANDGRYGEAGVEVPDHIAVYVGDGQVVNGGWNGNNVVQSGIDVPQGTQYYIAINQ